MNALATAFAQTSTAPALLVLADATIKSTVLLLCVIFAAPLLRKKSAATKHALWVGALAGLLLLPVFSFALPEWRVPWLPDWRPAAHIPATQTPAPSISLAPLAPPEISEPPLAETAAASVSTTGPVMSAPAILRDTALPDTIPPIAVEPVFAPTQFTPAAAPTISPVAAAPVVPPTGIATLLARWTGWIWLFGMVVALWPTLTGLAQAFWITHRGRELNDDAWNGLREKVAGEIGLRRAVRLRAAPGRAMPFTWGAWRPVVIFPKNADEWPESRRQLVLRHEFGHIKRWDWLTQTIGSLACALYWFNPLAWIAARQARLEREQACDDLVLRCGSSPGDYARELLEIAAHSSRDRLLGWAAVPMARPSTLETRLRAILDGQRNRHSLTRVGVVALAVLVAAIVIPISMLQAATPTPEAQPVNAVARAAPPDQPKPDDDPAGPAPTTDHADTTAALGDIPLSGRLFRSKATPALGDIPLIGRLFASNAAPSVPQAAMAASAVPPGAVTLVLQLHNANAYDVVKLLNELWASRSNATDNKENSGNAITTTFRACGRDNLVITTDARNESFVRSLIPELAAPPPQIQVGLVLLNTPSDTELDAKTLDTNPYQLTAQIYALVQRADVDLIYIPKIKISDHREGGFALGMDSHGMTTFGGVSIVMGRTATVVGSMSFPGSMSTRAESESNGDPSGGQIFHWPLAGPSFPAGITMNVTPQKQFDGIHYSVEINLGQPAAPETNAVATDSKPFFAEGVAAEGHPQIFALGADAGGQRKNVAILVFDPVWPNTFVNLKEPTEPVTSNATWRMPDANFEKVQPGMTRTEVNAIMGPPDGEYADNKIVKVAYYGTQFRMVFNPDGKLTSKEDNLAVWLQTISHYGPGPIEDRPKPSAAPEATRQYIEMCIRLFPEAWARFMQGTESETK